MSQVDADSVRARLLAMRELLDHLASLGTVTAGRLGTDFGLRLQVERVLSQVITLATEINMHVTSRVLGRAPAGLREGFETMATAGWLTDDLARQLQGSTGLRNVLVHEYVRVDLEIVAESVPLVLEGYGTYIREVASRL